MEGCSIAFYHGKRRKRHNRQASEERISFDSDKHQSGASAGRNRKSASCQCEIRIGLFQGKHEDFGNDEAGGDREVGQRLSS